MFSIEIFDLYPLKLFPMNPNSLLILLLAILLLDFLLDQVLEYINLKHQKKEIPAPMAGYYEEEKYQKSLDYQGANVRFGFLTATFGFILSFLLLALGGFGWIDSLVRQWVEGELAISLVFFGVIFIASDLLTLPFQLYRTFVIEERYGFNRTTVGTFIGDKLKGYLLTLILGGLLLGSLLWLVQHLGPWFWLYFMGVAAGFIFLANIFYTSLILPLFNTLSPLEEGELKAAIEAYASKVGFPLSNVYVIDGSKRSGKSNAFFTGFGKRKKIVLYDTLIANHTTEELVAVLAHEVGHYKKKHIQTGYIWSIIQVGITLWLLGQFIFNESLSLALGAEGLAFHINLIAFGILFTPISHITGLLMNIISRKNEFEADHFAASTYSPGPLKEALKKLSVHNLSNLHPHPAYVFVNYSHPPLLERLRHLDDSN
jgi:STE24 endopeptidase